MQLGRLYVENSLVSIRRRSACLLNDEGEWTGLVQKSQLAALVLSVRRIGEQSTAEQIAMEISDERPDVTSIHRLAIAVDAAVVVHEVLHFRLPLSMIRIVDRQISAQVRRANV